MPRKKNPARRRNPGTPAPRAGKSQLTGKVYRVAGKDFKAASRAEAHARKVALETQKTVPIIRYTFSKSGVVMGRDHWSSVSFHDAYTARGRQRTYGRGKNKRRRNPETYVPVAGFAPRRNPSKKRRSGQGKALAAGLAAGAAAMHVAHRRGIMNPKRNPTEDGVVARYAASDGETAQIVHQRGVYYVQFAASARGPFSSGGSAMSEKAARKLIPPGFRKVQAKRNPSSRRKNPDFTPFSLHRVGGKWGVYLGEDRYAGKSLVHGFKTRKEASRAKTALEDARYDGSRGRKHEYHVNGRYGYFAVDYDGGARTAITGITRKLAKDMALTLRDANNGWLNKR